jgi:hypothetical protein
LIFCRQKGIEYWAKRNVNSVNDNFLIHNFC